MVAVGVEREGDVRVYRVAEKLRQTCLTVEGTKMFASIIGPTESGGGSARGSAEYYYKDEYGEYYGGYSVEM